MSRAMHDSNDQYAVIDFSIKNEIPTNDEVAQACRQIGPCGSHARMLGKVAADVFDFVEQAVRGVGVITRDVSPYFDKIRVRPGGAGEPRHVGSTFDGGASRLELTPGFLLDVVDACEASGTACQSFGPKTPQFIHFVQF
jgi:hypothetical protein